MTNNLRLFTLALLLQCGAVWVATAAAPAVIPPGYLRVEVPSALSASEYANAGRSMMLVAAMRPGTGPAAGVVLVDRVSGQVVGTFTKAQLLAVRSPTTAGAGQ